MNSGISPYIEVHVPSQTLRLYNNQNQAIMETLVATAKNGVGEMINSEQTPRGWHYIRAKIGADLAPNTVFVGRRPTGEIYSPQLRALYPQRDWILTRILWLSGLEAGKNRLGPVDTMRRYVYIHGCPDTDKMGVPSSHGCVKMRNSDVIALFDQILVGCRMLIKGE